MRSWIPEPFINGWPRIAGPDGIGLMVGAFVKGGAIRRGHGKIRARPSPHRYAGLMWTLSLPPGLSLTGDEFRTADANSLHAIAREVTKDWHPSLRRLIDEAEIAATFPVMLRSSEPVACCCSGRIISTTLLCGRRFLLLTACVCRRCGNSERQKLTGKYTLTRIFSVENI